MTKDEHGMRISAVSKITGIPTDTLRAWERRYDLVKPKRKDSASRVYSREDVQKLTLVKMLVDRGHAISNVAASSTEELNELLALHVDTGAGVEALDRPVGIVVCGDVISSVMKYDPVTDPRIEMKGIYSTASAAQAKFGKTKLDVLVLEYASLHRDRVNEIIDLFRESGASQCFVVYGYSNRKTVSRLESQGAQLIKAPVKPKALIESILTSIPVNQPVQQGESDVIDLPLPAAQYRYSMETLARLSAMDNPLACECPQHLADLIMSLTRFEMYSADCENRNDEDAELHHLLYQVSGHSRNILESALQKVIEVEGIKL